MQLSVREIYEISHKGGRKLYLEDYTIPKKYIQTSRQEAVSSRSLSLKKNNKPKQNYLDDYVKVYKYVPGVGTYEKTKKWNTERQELVLKQKNSFENLKKLQSKTPRKITYFELIEKKQQKEKSPGPGQYDVDRSFFHSQDTSSFQYRTLNNSSSSAGLVRNNHNVSQSKSENPKFFRHTRPSYIDQQSFLSSQTPGVGMYSPRNPRDMNKVQHVYDAKKASPKPRIQIFTSTQKTPGVGQYTPLPVIYKTFAQEQSKSPPKIVKIPSKNSKSPNINSLPHLGFGIEKRSRSNEDRLKPNIGFHDLSLKWMGKSDPKNKSPNVLDKISTGINRSIYY